MALTVTIDMTATPPTATAKSDLRKVSFTVKAVGETATGTGQFPITGTDSSGHVWTLKSDDGATTVWTY